MAPKIKTAMTAMTIPAISPAAILDEVELTDEVDVDDAAEVMGSVAEAKVAVPILSGHSPVGWADCMIQDVDDPAATS